MGKKNSVDKAILRAAQEAAEGAVDDILSKAQQTQQAAAAEDDDEFIIPSRFRSDQNSMLGIEDKEIEADQIDDLISSIPVSEGYYIKLYKELEDLPGQYEYKDKIEDYAHWTDLEHEISNIVKQGAKRNPKRWGSGKYKILIYRTGSKGFQKKPINLRIDADEQAAISFNPNQDVQSKISEMGELMKQLKDFLPSATVSNPTDMVRSMAESLKMGVELAKQSMPTPAPAGSNDMMQQMLMMMKMMKEMGLIPSAPPVKEDSLDFLVKLKQAGLVKLPGEEADPLNSVSKIMELMHALQPLMPGANAETPSIWMRVADILAPKVPDMIGNITGAVKSMSDLSKAKLASKMGISIPPEIISQPMIENPTIQNQPIASEGDNLNPLLRQIFDAIETNDRNFFPSLESLITSWVSPTAVQQLVSGEINAKLFLANASSMLSFPYLNIEKSIAYFNDFIVWKKQSMTPVQSLNGETPLEIIEVKCNKCGVVYEVEANDFEKDTKICGAENQSGLCDGGLEITTLQNVRA